MEIVKLKGATKNYIWGGNRLFEFGKTTDLDVIAESWEVSFHNDGPTYIASGMDNGKELRVVASKEDLGTNCERFPFFPILNKLIDAKDNLSIQVHPSDEYALKNENSFGKTEMWYVVAADEGAMLHIGFNKDVSEEEIKTRIANNSLMEVMNHISVKPGDCYFIPSGTLHAIGQGCLVYEIQENSNLTYRVYDYGRIGKDGKPRELHVEKALKVLNLNKSIPENRQGETLAECEYFKVQKLVNCHQIVTHGESFATFTVIEGCGDVNGIPFKKGDSFFIPTNKIATINGDSTIIKTEIA